MKNGLSITVGQEEGLDGYRGTSIATARREEGEKKKKEGSPDPKEGNRHQRIGKKVAERESYLTYKR